MSEVICYIGYWNCRPPGIRTNWDLEHAHFSEFPEVIKTITESFWTNNPYVVDCLPPEKVVICGFVDGKWVKRKLSESGLEDFLGEFKLGEVWGNLGDDRCLKGKINDQA